MLIEIGRLIKHNRYASSIISANHFLAASLHSRVHQPLRRVHKRLRLAHRRRVELLLLRRLAHQLFRLSVSLSHQLDALIRPEYIPEAIRRQNQTLMQLRIELEREHIGHRRHDELIVRRVIAPQVAERARHRQKRHSFGGHIFLILQIVLLVGRERAIQTASRAGAVCGVGVDRIVGVAERGRSSRVQLVGV